MATYTGQVVSDKIYAANECDRSVHIAIRFRRKKSYSNRHQSYKVAPHPAGISGGAALAWPHFLKERMNAKSLKVAGIVHTYKEQSNILIATKIAPFIYAIIEESPHLAKHFKSASKDIGDFGTFISEKLKALNKSNAPSAIGIPWYLPDTYERCLAIFDDASDLPEMYQDWIIRAIVTEKQLISKDLNVVRVNIDAVVFKKWCKTNRIKKRDKHARMLYCSMAAREVCKTSETDND